MAIMINVTDSFTTGERFLCGLRPLLFSLLQITSKIRHKIITEMEEYQPKIVAVFNSRTQISAMSELPNFGEQTGTSRLLTHISEAKGSCSETLNALHLLEKFFRWPSEETAKPLKHLFERGKSTCEEPLTQGDIDKTSEMVRPSFVKKRSAETEDEAKETQLSDRKVENFENTNLEYDLDFQPCYTSDEAPTLNMEKAKIFLSLPNFGVSQHSHKYKQNDKESTMSGKMQHEIKLERDNLELKRKLKNESHYLRILTAKMEDMEGENSSLKEQLKVLETEHMETLSELGRMMVEHTAEENKKRESEQYLGKTRSSILARKNGTSNDIQNPKQSISGEIANSNKQAVQGAKTSAETNHCKKGKGKEGMVQNHKDARKLQEEESQSLYKTTSNDSETATKGCGKAINQSGKTMKEKIVTGFASTSTDESENQGSMLQSYEDLSFSVEQDEPNDRDHISLSNQPPTSVATTLYYSYKLLLLTLAERLLSSDDEQLKNWASQNFSIETSRKATDALFQLDHKEIINASNLSPLKDFFESIVRYDLVYIIDAFLLGDYDVLRYNPRKPEVDANREQRLRQRPRSDYTSPLNGVSFHSASLQNGAERNSEASRKSENSDEVQTLIPHLPIQTPFPTFPTLQHTTNRGYTSSYQDENLSSRKYGQQTLEPDSISFTASVVADDDPVKRESRLTSNNSSASANSTLNQRRNTQTVGSNGLKHSKPLQPGTVQSNSRSPRNQAPDNDQEFEGNWLCNHYKRRCFVKFECCDKFWPCHRCHNNQSTCGRKKLKSRDTKKLKCANCNKVQEFGQYCRDCNAKFAKYYCGLCKHLTGTDDHPYHCEKCGICRIHGNRSFHCDICGVCLDVQLRGNLKCREGSAHDECCICLEDAFTGCQILPCSHKVHKECATQMIRSGIRRCPICRESFAHKLERRPLSDPKNRSGK